MSVGAPTSCSPAPSRLSPTGLKNQAPVAQTTTRLPMLPILRNRSVENQDESELSTSKPRMSSLSTSFLAEPKEPGTPDKQTVQIVPTLQDTALANFTSEPLTETTYLDNVQLIPSLMATPMDDKLSSTYERLVNARRVARPGRRKPTLLTDPTAKLRAQHADGLRVNYEHQQQQEVMRSPSAPLGQRTPTPQQYLLRLVDPSDRLARNAQLHQAKLAESAIAGLRSSENFNKAKSGLRQVADSDAPSLTDSQRQLLPYKSLMLLHIKGRRNLQVRLVSPSAESLNSGDCFLLVSQRTVFAWFGQLANVVEMNKCRELADWVCRNHELGYQGPSVTCLEVLESLGDANACGGAERVDEPVQGNSNELQFWQALGYDSVQLARKPGDHEEDDYYVSNIQRTNRVYEVTTTELTPCEAYWGRPIPHSLLKSNQALVFDFGTEVYLWTGKHISRELRKAGIDLVLQAYANSYDYSSCSVNPFDPLCAYPDLPASGSKRPDWTLVGRLTENGESVLFKEKFLDWPDAARIRLRLPTAKSDACKKTKPRGPANPLTVLPYPADRLYSAAFSDPPPPPVLLILDGQFVGRGGCGARNTDGILRHYRVESGPLRLWHVSEFTRTELPVSSHGQFHEADTYVIRWPFRVAHIGLRKVSSRTLEQTREHCAYFFWQGSKSKVTEKGAAAVMTIELDEERGPQIRVAEGKEPPAFCRLFEGRMIIHANRRHNANSSPLESTSQSRLRLFLVRGELPLEGHLVEVPARVSSLRPQGVFLVTQYQTSTDSLSLAGPAGRQIQKAWLWVGRLVSPNSLKVARFVAQRLKEDCPSDLAENLHQVVEVTQSDNRLGPGEMIFLLNAGDQEPPSFYTSIDTNHAPLVIWHVIADTEYKLSVSRLANPHQLDASVCCLDTPETTAGPSCDTAGVGQRRQTEPDESSLSSGEAVCNQLSLPFPLTDLYEVNQPGLFIVLAGRQAVYLWEGWWPTPVHLQKSLSRIPSRSSRASALDVEMTESGGGTSLLSQPSRDLPMADNDDDNDEDSETVQASGATSAIGSTVTRFYALRRAAMQTVKALADKVGCEAFLVYAGIEPLEFLTLFPPSIRNIQASKYHLFEKGKCNGQKDYIDAALLESLRGATYSLAELQQQPRPPDLDATCLEAFLSPEEFQKAFKMSKEEFDQLPAWRKHRLKKSLELF